MTMTTLATAVFAPAAMRILQISYHCDISREGGPVIPLGILADMRASEIYGLGLVARKSLSDDEAAHVGGIIREHISAPYDYLHTIFDEVIRASSPAAAFEALPDKHSLSLHFSMSGGVQTISLPKAAKTSHDARRLWVKDELHSVGNRAYWNMFGEKVPGKVEKESTEDLAA
jgi:hypothetical protein